AGTRRQCGIVLRQECPGRRERSRGVAGRGKEASEAAEDGRIVVHDEHRKGDVAFAHSAATDSRCTGSVKLASAPPSDLLTRASRPPCAWMIVEQIDSPSPSPCGLVVKNGSNTRRPAVGETPGPCSLTPTPRAWAPPGRAPTRPA